MSLLGRLIPTQVTGKDDEPLFADLNTEELEQKIAAKLMAAGLTEEQASAFLGAQ
jgi:hypothetical protein